MFEIKQKIINNNKPWEINVDIKLYVQKKKKRRNLNMNVVTREKMQRRVQLVYDFKADFQ